MKERKFMHHKIDIKPIPEHVLYVNDLFIAGEIPYQTGNNTAKAIEGITESNGGILPDDNVRIYVPMDLNEETIMYQLHLLYTALGIPTEDNEIFYSLGLRKIIYQLEIYDQIWFVRTLKDAEQEDGKFKEHSSKGTILAKQIVKYLEDKEGIADCYPYDQINELKGEFQI